MDRTQQIIEQARNRSEMCTSQNRDIYRIAYREGAEWADETKEQFIETVFEVKRQPDGKMTENFRQKLMHLPINVCCIAKDENDGKVYLLDPEVCSENEYKFLDDNTSLTKLAFILITI